MNEEQPIAETVFERSDKKWHYWDKVSSRWSEPYETEDDARRAELGIMRAA
jgi:hypothetical protein